MLYHNYPSRLLQDAVEELSSLPGVGRKSALRFAMHLLKQPKENVERFGQSIIRLSKESKFCRDCFMISDYDVCEICADSRRDHSIICVVESIRDVISIENTMQYNGIYHVLGGIISPMDGVGPSDLTIEQLLRRVEDKGIEEVL
ncbi:MAG TPA: recombination mediator RecR, partial [Bacteroidales bacterium]|nr:recombination mediator RecR [Bacteroidales bacterium]